MHNGRFLGREWPAMAGFRAVSSPQREEKSKLQERFVYAITGVSLPLECAISIALLQDLCGLKPKLVSLVCVSVIFRALTSRVFS
jgi:hypothetical protein